MFETFRNKCIEIYESDSAHFQSAPRLAWKSCLKKTGIELELLTNIELLLMVEKGIGESICHAVHRYTKAKKKYMRNYHKNKESSYLQYLDASNLYGWLISRKLPVGGLKWKKCMLKFN